MDFPCTGCGLCCKRVGPAVIGARKLVATGNENVYVKDVAAFPYSFDATGKCENLLPDNKCAVYENRPLVCDIGRVWEKHHQPGGIITKESYFLSAAELCNSMMVEANTNENFFIDTNQIPLL